MRMEKKCFDDQFQCSALSKEKIDALVDIGFTWARPKKGAKLQQEKIGWDATLEGKIGVAWWPCLDDGLG